MNILFPVTYIYQAVEHERYQIFVLVLYYKRKKTGVVISFNLLTATFDNAFKFASFLHNMNSLSNWMKYLYFISCREIYKKLLIHQVGIAIQRLCSHNFLLVVLFMAFLNVQPVRARYYIALMNVAQDLIFFDSYYIKILMIHFQFNDAYLKQHSLEKPY